MSLNIGVFLFLKHYQTMKQSTKYRILYHLAFAGIFVSVWFMLHFTTNLENTYKGAICAVAAVLLAPKVKTYQTPSGKKLQVKWFKILKEISDCR